ncbi:ribonuclease H-like protein [Pholiota conissans]|uniref:RNA exonuclease 4 n=1 Tax=Pholiota conissans TaxID=109636 RepID=A0A9P5YYH8_9AGAR|nr:ribonuclease H-like protein [Pholiota conissans]
MSSSKGKSVPSSNWLALQKRLEPTKKTSSKKRHRNEDRSHKLRKIDEDDTMINRSSKLSITSKPAKHPTAGPSTPSAVVEPLATSHKNGESIAALQQMVLGHVEYTAHQELSGKYLSLDCEMVGVGIDGAESSLARISLVNFYGAVILDEFVRQKERVVDYRTQWSGIRESDMINAHKFEDIQKRVADLLQDRILVGHAVHNDLKALLLSHPRPQTRDTQIYAYKFGVVKSKRPALRNLVKQELGLTIQTGEHSSITDARATMAVYRLHKREWEKGSRPHPTPSLNSAAPAQTSKKRKTMDDAEFDSGSDSDDSEDEAPTTIKPVPRPPIKTKVKTKSKTKTTTSEFPGGGRKGVSSGLSTITRTGPHKAQSSGGVKGRDSVGAASTKNEWWKQLPGSLPTTGGSKGSIRISVKGSN